jgi:hypothetical protein
VSHIVWPPRLSFEIFAEAPPYPRTIALYMPANQYYIDDAKVCYRVTQALKKKII